MIVYLLFRNRAILSEPAVLAFYTAPVFSIAAIFPEILALGKIADFSAFLHNALAINVFPPPEPQKEKPDMLTCYAYGSDSTDLSEHRNGADTWNIIPASEPFLCIVQSLIDRRIL